MAVSELSSYSVNLMNYAEVIAEDVYPESCMKGRGGFSMGRGCLCRRREIGTARVVELNLKREYVMVRAFSYQMGFPN